MFAVSDSLNVLNGTGKSDMFISVHVHALFKKGRKEDREKNRP